MAGQLLDISKFDNAVKHESAWAASRSASGVRRARLYRFPAPAPAQKKQPEVPKSRFRLRLALELAIGFFVWLTWFLWMHLH